MAREHRENWLRSKNLCLIDLILNSKVVFIISASSHKTLSKNQDVVFMDEKRLQRFSLVINYIKERKNALGQVQNLRYTVENNIVKLE